LKISYLIYGLLIAGWVFTDAPIRNRSRWWAIAVLVLPLLTPYYFVKTRPSNKYWKLIGIWVAGFLVFYTAATVLELDKNYFNQHSGRSLLTAENENLKWNRIKIGTSGFSINSPAPLKPAIRQIPEEVQTRVLKMEFFECDAKPYMLFITMAEYRPGTEITLQDAVSGSMENMSNAEGVSNFQFSQKKIVISGRKGSVLEGSFLSGGKEVWSFGCSIIMDGQKAWQVLGMYPANNLSGRDIVTRILKSIEFQDN
jgi:hypothetical protein